MEEASAWDKNVPIPTYEELMLPLLELCETGPLHVREISSRLAMRFDLTDAERQQQLPSGRGVTTVTSRTHWAKTYLKQAGLVAQPSRGVVALTEAGRALLRERPDRIDSAFLRRYPGFRTFLAKSHPEQSAVGAVVVPDTTKRQTPDERIDAAYAELETDLRAGLLDAILAAPPSFFERLIVDLLVGMGYGGSHEDAGERLGRSGDGGVDGVIREDRLGLDRIYLQAKRYQPGNKVGSSALQTFVGALYGQGSQKGVFITTSEFTADARHFASGLGHMRIVLIDGDALTRLMVKHGVGVRTDRVVELKRLDQDYFDRDDAEAG